MRFAYVNNQLTCKHAIMTTTILILSVHILMILLVYLDVYTPKPRISADVVQVCGR